jgi:hypothetical protein
MVCRNEVHKKIRKQIHSVRELLLLRLHLKCLRSETLHFMGVKRGRLWGNGKVHECLKTQWTGNHWDLRKRCKGAIYDTAYEKWRGLHSSPTGRNTEIVQTARWYREWQGDKEWVRVYTLHIIHLENTERDGTITLSLSGWMLNIYNWLGILSSGLVGCWNFGLRNSSISYNNWIFCFYREHNDLSFNGIRTISYNQEQMSPVPYYGWYSIYYACVLVQPGSINSAALGAHGLMAEERSQSLLCTSGHKTIDCNKQHRLRIGFEHVQTICLILICRFTVM